MARPMRIAINGFGRIGRTVTRQVMQTGSDIEIVFINDIAALDTCAYLFRYDSAFGPFPGTVETGQNEIRINDRTIPFHASRALDGLDLAGIDVLLECTGRINDRARAQAGLAAGAQNVLISGPFDDADATLVLGANEQGLGDARIVSNASCTTNAIAPLLKVLDQRLGIERAHATTIHCYTGSQPTIDAPGPSLARSRAAAVSMIPTSTSAAEQIARVLPGLAGRLSVSAVRVPSHSVSAVDAVLQFRSFPDMPFGDFLRTSVADGHVIGLIEDACVSSDLRARPESLVLALPETLVTGGKQVRLFGWYDNEWGFSARMLDMARRMAFR